MNFTNTEAAALFSVSREQVRRWAKKYHVYMSPMANPPDEGMRQYNEDDMGILSLIWQSKRKSFQDIVAAIQNGQRGDLPDDVTALAMIGSKNIPAHLQKRVTILEAQIELLKKSNQELYEGKLQSDTRVDMLEKQLKEKELELRKAYEEIGQLKK